VFTKAEALVSVEYVLDIGARLLVVFECEDVAGGRRAIVDVNVD